MSESDKAVGALGPGHEGEPRIEVRCLSCGRVGTLESSDSRVGGAPLVRLTRRLRCSQCGSRAVQARTVKTPRDVARLLRQRMGAGE